MELALFVYLAGIADDLKITFGLIASLLSIILTMALVFYLAIEYDEDMRNMTKKTIKWSLPICLVCTIIALFTPNKNTIYLMAGGYAAQEVATGEIGNKVMRIINLELDKRLGGEE